MRNQRGKNWNLAVFPSISTSLVKTSPKIFLKIPSASDRQFGILVQLRST